MTAGQPFVATRARALPYTVFVVFLAAGLAEGCGSTSVTDVTGPDEVRCTASITADPDRVPATGGDVTITVASERDCTWSARSDATWLQVRSASGQGNGSFTATAASNSQPAARSGAIVVNDQRITISQTALACTFTLQGPSGPMGPSAGTGSVQISTPAGCAWTITSSALWLIPRTAAGTGSSVVTFDVQQNDGPEREASITIGDASVVVVQTAPAPLACTFAIAPLSREFTASGGEATLAMTAGPGCGWTVTGGSAWTTPLTTAGTGSGEARYRVDSNPATASRQTTLTVGGRVHTVTQQGIVCTFVVSPQTRNFASAGGNGIVEVTTQPGCPWTASSNAGWVSVAPSGEGPGQLSYQVLPNPLSDSRSARLTIGGKRHTVTQDAAAPPCSFEIDPAERAFGASGGPATVRVTTQPGCGWSAASGVDWATIAADSLSGTGTADVSYTVGENTASAERAGSLTIAGQSHLLTQDAAAPVCTYAIDPPSGAFAFGGGAAVVRVTTDPGCPWTATSSVPWASVAAGSESGSGTADVTYTVDEHTSIDQRTGTLTIAGLLHTITQTGVPVVCNYSLSPASRLFGAAGGAGTVQVTTAETCGWNAVSDQGWIAVLDGSGMGTSEIRYEVASASAPIDRTGTVVVNGEIHTVSQREGSPQGPQGGGRGGGTSN